MKNFEWNARTAVTVVTAFLLTASVGAMGWWLLLSGQPGTGMMEQGNHATMMANQDHAVMMGSSANRGALGGYTGMLGLVMILVFVVIVGLLLYTLLSEQPGQPQPAVCWHCERPVETDWTICPYCGVELAGAGRPPKPVET